MTQIQGHARELAAITGRIDRAAADSRPTFTDETRANFDHHVVAAVSREVKQLESQTSQLDALLEQALRLLQ